MRPNPTTTVRAATASTSSVQHVANAFRLGVITRVEVITEGLMNRNWRVTTTTGQWAIKQVIDVDAAAARRQHRATAPMARLSLPVPAPVTTDFDSVVVIDGAVYAVLPWARGAHRHGLSLTVAEAAALGGLLARLHAALAENMPPAPNRLVAAPVAAPVPAETLRCRRQPRPAQRAARRPTCRRRRLPSALPGRPGEPHRSPG